MIGTKYSPSTPSKKKCLILIGLILCLYVMDNPFITSFFSSQVLNYLVKPLWWIGMALVVWFLPEVRPQGKLRLRGFINLWAFNLAIIFTVVSVLGGIIDGFGLSPYTHSLKGIALNILVVGSTLVGREFVRSYLVNTLVGKEDFRIFAAVALFMTFITFPFNKYTDFKGYEDIVKFAAQFIGTEFSKNLLATYLAFLGGPIPSIIYIGLLDGFNWLSPILPNLKWITAALIGILTPIFSLTAMQSIYSNELKPFHLTRGDKDEEGPFGWMVTSLASIGIIWFTVGVFPVYPSVIATGSMIPMIQPGDVILVKKSIDKNNLNLGEVIQFQRDDILISHRIIEMIEERGIKSYRTKGDNNSVPDPELVSPEKVKGQIIGVVPKIGWPTLLVKSQKAIPKGVEF